MPGDGCTRPVGFSTIQLAQLSAVLENTCVIKGMGNTVYRGGGGCHNGQQKARNADCGRGADLVGVTTTNM